MSTLDKVCITLFSKYVTSFTHSETMLFLQFNISYKINYF